MKYIKLFLLLISLTSLYNFSALNAQWHEISANLPENWGAFKIDAVDSLTAIGPQHYDSVYITTDGGLIWNPIWHPSGIDDISMVSPKHIWFCNGDGEIYCTSDGGINWQLQFYDTSLTEFMNYIEMFDSLNGIAMGDAKDNSMPAIFLRTTDGGNNWISTNQNYLIGLYSGDQWRRVDFVDISTGYFYSSGESPQRLYKTTNGGEDWAAINDTLDCKVLKFYDENIGIAISFKFVSNEYLPVIYRTTDGGVNWTYITFSTDHWTWGTDIEFAPVNPSKIWITTNPVVFTSDDYGTTWTEQVHVEDMQFLDMIFTDNNYGWLIGRNLIYNIYRTSNGGNGGIVSVENNNSNQTVNTFSLEQNYPNPFNSSTKIKFTISSVETRDRVSVRLKVYDVLGNEVTTLFNEELPTGDYEVEFNVRTSRDLSLPSGIYFYQLVSSNYIDTKKMLLLK